MFKKVDYLMVLVSDMSRSVAFYRDQLGLPLRFESPGWSELLTGDTTLALHPAPPADAVGEARAGTCSLGFTVDNVDQAYETLKTRGIDFVMTPTYREKEGIRLAMFRDPDGLSISIAQPVKGQLMA